MNSPLKVDAITYPESLDPEDWSSFREVVHEAADCLVDHIEGIRERPVWRPVPDRNEIPFVNPQTTVVSVAKSASQSHVCSLMGFPTSPRYIVAQLSYAR